MDFTFVTVAYADIFDYPLTSGELQRWMIMHPARPTSTPKIEHESGYYFLKGRRTLVSMRKKRENFQKRKWDIAKYAARLLSYIPTIQLVGVTGGLAMNNAGERDDIDLFLVVSHGTLWTSRLCATIYMDLLGLRRHPNDVAVKNKVCLNMFVTENGMAIVSSERDVFSAHEVLQMEPLFDRNNVYKKFLKANSWVQAYLPNAWKYRRDK